MKLGLVPALLAASLLTAQTQKTHGLYRSVDRGQNWQSVGAGLPASARINALAAMGGTTFAGTDAGVFTSTDEGGSWIGRTLPSEVSGRILSLAVIQNRIFAGTDRNGLIASGDEGRTWSRVASFPGRRVNTLVHDGTMLYAGTDGVGVYSSIDGGSTWSALENGLPADAQVFALAVAGGRLYAGLYAKGLYVWEDLVRRWERAGEVVPLVLAASGSTLVLGHNPGGLYWGDVGAASFAKASGAPLEAPVWAMGAGEGLVLAGAASGIYRSEDGGHSWTQSVRGLPAESPGVAFLVHGGVALASTVQSGR